MRPAPLSAASSAVTATLCAAVLAACTSAGGNAPSAGPGGRTGPTPGPTFETRNLTPARAELRDADGKAVGTASFTQAPHGLLIAADLTGLPAGVHAMHVHDVGRCEPPFTTAGGHYNPLFRQHGVKNRAGYHAGDLPNFTAPASGSVRVEFVTRDLQVGAGIGTLFDGDGSSIMVHSTADDYQSDPGGNSGTRLACGVITRSTDATPAASPAAAPATPPATPTTPPPTR